MVKLRTELPIAGTVDCKPMLILNLLLQLRVFAQSTAISLRSWVLGLITVQWHLLTCVAN